MKREILNYVGGLPDFGLSFFPGLLRKRRYSPEHLDELSFYFPEKWIGAGKQFLSVPGDAPEHAVDGTDRSRREDVAVEVIKYPSRYQPRNPRLREAFRKHARNLDGYLVWWRHKDGPGRRPLVLCVHGLLMAEPGRAERMFRIWKLLKLGLDVALYIQPFHWKRSRAGRQYLVNSNNVPYSIEVFGQNIHDLQSAVLLLKSQGYDRIGLIGASLGGYTLALYSTVSPPVDFLFLVVPLIDLYDFLQPRRASLSLFSGEEADSPIREAIKVISPLANEPRSTETGSRWSCTGETGSVGRGIPGNGSGSGRSPIWWRSPADTGSTSTGGPAAMPGTAGWGSGVISPEELPNSASDIP